MEEEAYEEVEEEAPKDETEIQVDFFFIIIITIKSVSFRFLIGCWLESLVSFCFPMFG